MAGIFGKLGLADTDRVFNATAGQQAIYEEAANWIAERNRELDAVLAVFVEQTGSNYKQRYKLPGGGHLARRGPDGRYGAVKAYGYWDVALQYAGHVHGPAVGQPEHRAAGQRGCGGISAGAGQ
jgi:hypothetical protein